MIVDARLFAGGDDRLCDVVVAGVSLLGDSPPPLLFERDVVVFFALFAAVVVAADDVEIVDDIRLILFVLFLLFGAGGYSFIIKDKN